MFLCIQIDGETGQEYSYVRLYVVMLQIDGETGQEYSYVKLLYVVMYTDRR